MTHKLEVSSSTATDDWVHHLVHMSDGFFLQGGGTSVQYCERSAREALVLFGKNKKDDMKGGVADN
jgi:hypothetical protein